MSETDDYLESVIVAARAVDLKEIDRTVDLLAEAYRKECHVFIVGNGGSAANAAHLAQDLSKGSVPSLDGKRIKVMSLVDNIPFITAIANDIGYDRVFDIQLKQFAGQGDVLIAISGSGNSPNILSAVRLAKKLKMKVVGVTGFGGGKLRKMSDVRLHVPCDHMCKSEAVHGIIFHMIADLLKERLAK